MSTGLGTGSAANPFPEKIHSDKTAAAQASFACDAKMRQAQRSEKPLQNEVVIRHEPRKQVCPAFAARVDELSLEDAVITGVTEPERERTLHHMGQVYPSSQEFPVSSSRYRLEASGRLLPDRGASPRG
jgi:hypothetical protein